MNTEKAESTTASGVIVVLGSLHYDIMVEAPHRPRKGETVTGQRWFPKFGGKGGNQAVAAKRHGAEVRFVSATGSDNFADYLLARLAEADISREFVAKLPSVETGMSVAITDSDGDYGAVIVSGANQFIPADALHQNSLWSTASLALLQNEVPESLNLVAARQARNRNIPICLNAAPARTASQELLSMIDILVVNAVEAQALDAGTVDSLEAAGRAAKQLSARFPTAIVTAGGHGVAVCSSQCDALSLPAVNIEVVSTHGAGDVFTGTLCAEISTGASLPVAVKMANECAAVHVAS